MWCKRRVLQTICPTLRTNLYGSINSNDTERGDTLYAILFKTILITKVFRSGLEQIDRNFVSLLHCNNYDIDIFREKLKGVKFCGALVREKLSQILGNEKYLNKKERTK